MEYHVKCDCGDAVTVSEAAAGTTVSCTCGRMVAVPSLRVLRRHTDAPEPNLSPDLVVESLLLAGKLPLEDHCVLCDTETDVTVNIQVECARVVVKSDWLTELFRLAISLVFGWLGALLTLLIPREYEEHGRDISFT